MNACINSGENCQAEDAPQAARSPLSNWNRPGLSSLRYRVGTHAAFMASMQQRLQSSALQGLSTREISDPSIALLDAWASVADVLSFYQERIANEGYLRTATERRSIVEMARLVGYTLKPGVAASVYLAYTVDKNQAESTLLPIGARVQSIPGPEESAQSFETSEELLARADWNNLRPRSDAPQNIRLGDALNISQLYLAGTSTNLKVGDKILLRFVQKSNNTDIPVLRTVSKVEPLAASNRTKLHLSALPALAHIVAQWLYVLAQKVASYTAAHADNLNYEAKKMAEMVNFVMQQTWLGNLEAVHDVINIARIWIATGKDQIQDPPAVAGNASFAAVNNSLNNSQPVGTASTYSPDNLLDIRISVPPPTELEAALKAFQHEVLEAVRADGNTPGNGGTVANTTDFTNRLLQATVPQARNAQQLRRNLMDAFQRGADLHPRLLFNFAPNLREHFYNAWANAELAQNSQANPILSTVYAMRANLALFGASVPKPADFEIEQKLWVDWTYDSSEDAKLAWLDGAHEAIVDGSLVVISKLGGDPNGRGQITRDAFSVAQSTTMQRTAYGVSGKSTRLTLDRNWWLPNANTTITQLRSVLVLAQSEALELALAPIEGPIFGQEITLDGLYKELESGRWIILSGERADIDGVSNVKVAELLMISGLRQEYDPYLPGDSIHTTLILATNTAYKYKRDSITIYGNVVKATHGETRFEVLGSGNGAASMQSFVLKQAPLTFVSSNSRSGVASTLSLRVDNITWHETDSLSGSGPQARQFVSKTSDDGKTTLCFGNGIDGARLPTGAENVHALYRQGLGEVGNVRAGQISMLMSRPLGVREVINPLRASGGANPESRDQARKNLPLAVMALDRLVSLQDYADFARTFGGIGKAKVARVSDGRRPVIHLTIAGANDAPIDTSSDLYRNLLAALRENGDMDAPLLLQVRELMLMVVNARIKLQADYLWEAVEAQVRQRLLDTFSFERRELGQAALLCEVIAAMQNVAGVAYVDVESFGGIPEKVADGETGVRRLLSLDELAQQIEIINDPAEFSQDDDAPRVPPAILANQAGLEEGVMRPAQLILASREIADTIILNQIT